MAVNSISRLVWSEGSPSNLPFKKFYNPVTAIATDQHC